MWRIMVYHCDISQLKKPHYKNKPQTLPVKKGSTVIPILLRENESQWVKVKYRDWSHTKPV